MMRIASKFRRAAHAALGFRRSGKKDPLQVAALPYRKGADGAVEVLLVTTRGTGQWMVPKGWPMAGKSLAESAAQEAYEEAGVRGSIGDAELGRFTHLKSDLFAGPTRCTVAVFPLAVGEELDSWPERGERTRSWFPAAEAARQVQSRALGRIIAAVERL